MAVGGAPAAVLRVIVDTDTGPANRKLTKFEQRLSRSQVAASKFAKGVDLAGAAVAGGLVYGLFKAGQAGVKFERQMSSLGAVSNASAKQMKRLEAQALKLGESTAFTAKEVAEAQTELAKGGLTVKQIYGGGVKAALNLAAAGQLQLGEAAETTVNAMKLFGIQAKDAGKVADVLATAANKTTGDVSDFAMALKMGGGVAKIAGLTFQETVTALEAMAEAGYKNSDAGTSLKTFFLALTKDSKKTKEAIKELGLEIFNSKGQMKALPAVAAELRKAFGDLTEEQFLNKAGTVAGSDAIRTLYALYDAGPAKLRKLEQANKKQGTAQEVAAKQMDNFQGEMEELQGAAETLGIRIFKVMKPALQEAVKWATALTKEVSAIFSDKTLTGPEKFKKAFGLIVDKVVPLWEDAMTSMAEVSAENAPKVALAFVKGFVNAGIWGKLFTGAYLFGKLGGAGGFSKLGSAAGKKWAGAFITAVVGAELVQRVAEFVNPPKLDDSKREAFARELKEFFKVATSQVKFGKGDNVRITTELGTIIFNAQTEKVIATAGSKLLKSLNGQMLQPAIRKFDSLKALKGSLSQSLSPLPGVAGTAGTRMQKSLLPKLDDLVQGGEKKAKAFRDKVGGQFLGLSETVAEANTSIVKSLSSLLQSLNLPTPKGFNVQKALKEMPELKSLPGKQRGGQLAMGGLASMVPGTSTGDRHTLSLNGVPIANVESREGIFVGNRNMMGALQQANAAVPRFQNGGLVHPAISGPEPLRSVGQGAVDKLYTAADKMYQAAKAQAGSAGYIAGGGGPVAMQIGRILRAQGFSKAAAAGIIGNAYAESTWNPAAMEPGTHNGGLWGFTAGEKSLASLEKFAARSGKPWTDVGIQTQFMLKTVSQSLKARLNSAGSAAEAARIFMEEWEKPGVPRLDVRESGARRAMKMRFQEGGEIPRRNLWAGVGPTGLQSGIRNLAAYVMDKYPGLQVTSTTGGTHAANSYHYKGQAVDLAGGNMNAAAEWIKQSSLYRALAEGIHNPNLSVEGGKLVPSSYWGSETWAAHANHIHLAVDHAWSKAGFKEGGGKKTKAEETAHTFKEDVPAEWNGLKTDSLNFGSVPKSLDGIRKELRQRRSEKRRYRRGVDAANKKKRPAIAQALQQNVTALEGRIRELERAQVKARVEKVTKGFRGKLGKQLGKLTGFAKPIEEAERGFNAQQQFAEQVVGLEPVEAPAPKMDLPPVPSLVGLDKAGREKAKEDWEKATREAERAYGKQREGEEQSFAARYADYVQNREGKAYGTLLEKAGVWRDSILGAERFAAGPWDKAKTLGGLEGHWEDKIISTGHRIKNAERIVNVAPDKLKAFIKQYKENHKGTAPKAKDYPKWLRQMLDAADKAKTEELPILLSADRELRKVLGEGQAEFYPGKSRIRENPTPPLAGTGKLEEELENLQGIHWPGLHEKLKKLPTSPVEGKFGGVIWDVQSQIDELDLKIAGAFESVSVPNIEWPEEPGEASSPVDDSAKTQRLEEMLRETKQSQLIYERQKPILERFAGFHAKGGFIPGGMWGIAGEAGPEIVHGPAQVYSNRESAAMASAAGPTVRVQIFEGQPDKTKVYINEQEVEAIIDRKNRSAGRSTKTVGSRVAGRQI